MTATWITAEGQTFESLDAHQLNLVFRQRNCDALDKGVEEWRKEQEAQKDYWRKHPAKEGDLLPHEAARAARANSNPPRPEGLVSPPEPPKPVTVGTEPPRAPTAPQGPPQDDKKLLAPFRRSPLFGLIMDAAGGDLALVARVARQLNTTSAPHLLLEVQKAAHA